MISYVRRQIMLNRVISLLTTFFFTVIEMDFIPAFDGNSFIELAPLEGPDSISIEVEFLTKADNGMLFYNGDNAEVDGDFISLNLKDGFVEYRYDLGSGPAEIR